MTIQQVPNSMLAFDGGALGFRNKLINGSFAINQRAVSGTVTLAAGAYGHDRWKGGASGCTYTFATVANVTTITISVGTLQQVIEGANLQSGTHILSWTGTAQARVDSGSYGASGLTGTAVGGTNQTIEVGIGTVSRVQYEPGSAITSFEFRPIGAELSLCQRYFQQLNLSANSRFYGAAQGTANMQMTIALPVRMRTAPVATSFNASDLLVTDFVSAPVAPTSLTWGAVTADGYGYCNIALGTAPLTVGRAAMAYSNAGTFYTTFSAEL